MYRFAMLLMALTACGGREEARSEVDAGPVDGGLDAADCYWTVFDAGPIFCAPGLVCPGSGDECNECYCVAKPSRGVYERNCTSHQCTTK